MSTSETESIPETQGMVVVGWSNDGTKVNARRQAGGEAASFWSVSILAAGNRRPIARGLLSPDGLRHPLPQRHTRWQAALVPAVEVSGRCVGGRTRGEQPSTCRSAPIDARGSQRSPDRLDDGQ